MAYSGRFKFWCRRFQYMLAWRRAKSETWIFQQIVKWSTNSEFGRVLVIDSINTLIRLGYPLSPWVFHNTPVEFTGLKVGDNVQKAPKQSILMIFRDFAKFSAEEFCVSVRSDPCTQRIQVTY